MALTVCLVWSAGAGAAEDPFAQNVRTTEPLAPEQELKAFHLPPGFEMQLVASEPEIGKPINLAFDSKGRLWVSQSREYPFPAQAGKERDKISILSDFDSNGKARKIETFVEHLNIPIGLYPYKDGVIAYSIPSISFYRQGSAPEVMYTKFGFERDTHGMSSNYKRGFDGWVYGCHGFNNTTVVAGSDGQAITMESGNTYRFKVDGSHIEYFTHGQTNPFGLCFDGLGNLYSCDSHSKPIYSLLRGGYYEGIGKTNDGLGFGPNMMTHLHGSTAIGGIVYYEAEQFPADFWHNVFVGNVVTSRVDRDSLSYQGSSPWAHEEEDFVKCDDPWFRPCNLVLGPDGAMYVADFYNRIIGHYEVPLDHPGRDRERGRIWRIVYAGKEAHTAPVPARADWSTATVEQLIEGLNDSNLTVRLLVTNELVDRVGKDAIDPLKTLMQRDPMALQMRHALWVLYRLGALDDKVLVAAMHHPDRGVRVHAMRILAEMGKWDSKQHDLAMVGLRDTDALVQRCAADAMGRHADAGNVRPLLDLLHNASPRDTHLVYAIKVALRDTGSGAGSPFSSLSNPSEQDVRDLADISLAINSADAGLFLMRHIDQAGSREQTTKYLRHAVQFLGSEQADELAGIVRKQFGEDLDFQLELLTSINEGFARSGAPVTPAIRGWALELVQKALKPTDVTSQAWVNYPIQGSRGTSADPWVLQQRNCRDDQNAMFLCSLPRGEQLTGILRSKVFTIPAKLSFYLAGHNGYPHTSPEPKNMALLRSAESHEVLMKALPPRNDRAMPTTWDLEKFAGQKGYLEIVDGDDGSAYAWIAFGRMNPEVVPMPLSSPSDTQHRQQSAAEITGAMKLSEVSPELLKWLNDSNANPDTRAAAAMALAQLSNQDAVSVIVPMLNDASLSIELRQRCAGALGALKSDASREALIASFKTAPPALQMSVAKALAEDSVGSKALLQAIIDGKAPARLLLDPSIKDRLAASNIPDLDKQIVKLTQGMVPQTQRIKRLMVQRKSAFVAAKTSIAAGEQVFTKNCRVCHSMDGQGKIIGPQLDGIGARGLDRLLEDVLDPSANVDPAFRTSNIYLKNGQVVSGLVRRQEGQTLIVADSQGKETAVPVDQIHRRFDSKLSLMPENFGQIIPPEDFNNLLAFLLSKRATAPKP